MNTRNNRFRKQWRRFSFIAALVVAMSERICGSEPFTNLGLDEPDVAALVPSGIPGVLRGQASHVLPGWTMLQGPTIDPIINLGVDRNWGGKPATLNLNIYDPRIGGDGYNLFLTTGDLFGNEWDTWLSQAGEIPTDADRLSLWIESRPGFFVSVDGMTLDLIPDPDRFRYYEVDVSPWKGRTVELRLGINRSAFSGGTTLDILGFKTLIPEPGAGTLLPVGAGCLWLVRRRSKRR